MNNSQGWDDRFFSPVVRKSDDVYSVVSSQHSDRPTRYEELASYILRHYSPKPANVESGGRLFRVAVFHPNDANDITYVVTDSEGVPAGCERSPGMTGERIIAYLDTVSQQVRMGEAILPEQVPDIVAHFLPPNLSRAAIWTCAAGRDALEKSNCDWLEPLDLRRVVILGDAGAGKTTLVRRFAMEMASRSASEDGDRPQLVPIYIQLRNEGRRSLEDTIRRRASALVEFGNSAEATARLLESGQIIALLDGVDEVTDEERSDCIHEIQEFANAYLNVRIMLTCRFSAYQQALAGFDHFCIDPLSKSQMRELVLMRLGDRRSLDRFIGRLEAEPVLESVASSPLLLSLLLARFQRDESSPHHLAYTVADFVAVLSDIWDSSRGIVRSRSRALRPMVRRNILEELALKAIQAARDTFTVSDLETVISGDAHLRSDVLAGIARATGIIERTSDGSWRFAHRALMEYLAAVYLLEAGRDIKTELVRSLTSDTWRSIWRFVCGIASRSGELVNSTLTGSPDTSEEKLRICLLVADALSESPSLTPAAVHKFGDMLVKASGDSLRNLGVTVAKSASVDVESNTARLRLSFQSLESRDKNGPKVKQLLTSLLRLRDGFAYDYVVNSFRDSDDNVLREFSKVMEREGRVLFSSMDDPPAIDCTISLRC